MVQASRLYLFSYSVSLRQFDNLFSGTLFSENEQAGRLHD